MPDGSTVLDFWQWAFGDLRSNATRGVLAEYLVARAVGAALEQPRIEWDNYDVLSPSGVRIEVKSAAYLQSWPQAGPSQIRYTGLTGLAWSVPTNTYSDQRQVRADVFVFALQTCRDPACYDPLSLDQWEFRVVGADTVRAWTMRSVGLEVLERSDAPALRWQELAAAITNAAKH